MRGAVREGERCRVTTGASPSGLGWTDERKEEMEALNEAIHEVADLAVNPSGYADDPDESEKRAERRDKLEVALRNVVQRETAAFVWLVYVVDSAEAYVFADAETAEKFAERYTDAIVTEEPVLPASFLEQTAGL